MSACRSCPTSRSTSPRCESGVDGRALLERARVHIAVSAPQASRAADSTRRSVSASWIFAGCGKRIAIGFRERRPGVVISFDDRGPFPVAPDVAGRGPRRAHRARCFRLRQWRCCSVDGGRDPRSVRHCTFRARHGGARGGPQSGRASRIGRMRARANFLSALRTGNHTLKRTLTDPTLLQRHRQCVLRRDSASGPVVAGALTPRLTDEQVARLIGALETLAQSIERLRSIPAASFRKQGHRIPPRYGRARAVRPTVSRLRHESAAHPVCRQRDELLPPVSDRGKLLADRSLSRLLKDDWPKSIDELERLRSESPR